MTKKEFLDRLSTKDSLSTSDKIEVCQHYIDNYAVNIHGITSKLMIKIAGGSDKAVDFAYNRLKSRIKEFEDE